MEKLACTGDISSDELESFIKGKAIPDMLSVDAMAKFLGIVLPEINVVDFFKSGYLPETMVNFLALLGWNPGDEREIMSLDELIASFDINRLAKANSLFDRKKLLAFNTEHIKITEKGKLLKSFKDYLEVVESPVVAADDKLLGNLLEISMGARTLAEIDKKCRFLFIENDGIEYDEKVVKKVLMKNEGMAILKIVRDKLAAMEQLSEQGIEDMLRSLAEERQVGLGKVAQPLRVAISGGTVSPPIFDSVKLLGRENTLARIDNTLKKFGTEG